MANSLISSVVGLLDSRGLDDLASRLGESRQAVSRGLESSAASLIDSLAHRSADSNWMSQIYRLISPAPSDLNVSNLALAAASPSGSSAAVSSVLDSGKQFLSQVFGGSQSFITEAIAKSSGLRSASSSVLMSLAAPMLMTSLRRLMTEEKLGAGQLGGVFSSAGAGVRNLVPSAVEELFEHENPAIKLDPRTSPPIAVGTVAEPREPQRSRAWLWLIPLLLLGGLIFWLMNRGQTPEVVSQVPQAVKASVANLGDFTARKLPDSIDLNIPRLGVEWRLLDFIQDPSKTVDPNTWFDFDRLLFDTDSATLRPESQEQLRNIAAILRAYPNVHMKIGGYTDNTGDAEHNLKLSQDRAAGVVGELTKLGIAPDRLEAEGYGSTHPVADNATESGRALNRRISMRLTLK